MSPLDRLNQNRLSVKAAAALANVDASTVHRWMLSGVAARRDRNGRARGYLKLPSFRIGGRRFVLESALTEFLTALEAADSMNEPAAPLVAVGAGVGAAGEL